MTRDELLDRSDLEFIAGAVKAARVVLGEKNATTPYWMAAVRAGLETERDRADRIIRLLDRAQVAFIRVPEEEG